MSVGADSGRWIRLSMLTRESGRTRAVGTKYDLSSEALVARGTIEHRSFHAPDLRQAVKR